MAPSGTCWEPSPPGHKEPKTLPPASVYYDLPRPIVLAPALLLPSTSAWIIGHSASADSSAHWLHLRHGLSGHTLLFHPPPLWLQLALPSLRLHCRPQLPQINFWPPDSHFEVVATRIFIIFPPPLLFSCMVGSIHVVLASDHSYGDRDIGPYGPSFHQHSSMAPHSSNAAMGHIPGCGLNNHQESPVQGHPLDLTELFNVDSFRSPVHLQSHLLPICAITSPAPFIIP